jgi:hypothetical protein
MENNMMIKSFLRDKVVRKEMGKKCSRDPVHKIRGDKSSFGYHVVRLGTEEKYFREYMTKNRYGKRVFSDHMVQKFRPPSA